MASLGWAVVRVSLGVYAGLCLLMFLRQRKYVYYPDRIVGLTPDYFRLPYEELRLQTADGETLGAWFLLAPDEKLQKTPVLLFCHGNAGNISHRLDALRVFHNLGFAVLIFDYRGYGKSTGTPSEQGTYLDAEAAWRYLTETRGVPSAQVVLYGESLGGAVACWLASRHPAGALVLESTFTSVPEMARRMFPLFPARWLCRIRYDSLSRISSVRCPVVVAHSPDDEMVPYEFGRQLFAAAPEPKVFLTLAGRHNDGGLAAHPPSQEKLVAFLAEHLPVCRFLPTSETPRR